MVRLSYRDFARKLIIRDLFSSFVFLSYSAILFSYLYHSIHIRFLELGLSPFSSIDVDVPLPPPLFFCVSFGFLFLSLWRLPDKKRDVGILMGVGGNPSGIVFLGLLETLYLIIPGFFLGIIAHFLLAPEFFQFSWKVLKSVGWTFFYGMLLVIVPTLFLTYVATWQDPYESIRRKN